MIVVKAGNPELEGPPSRPVQPHRVADRAAAAFFGLAFE